MSKLVLPISIVAAFLLVGCGGGSNSEAHQNITLKGYSIDPAIVGANVSLKCNSKTYEVASKTDNKGAFNIKDIPSSQDLTSCVLYSVGGNDGDDLSKLVLKVGYKLYNKHENIFITPFTTLVTNNTSYKTDIDNAILSKLIPIFLSSLLCYLSIMISFLEPKMIRKFIYLATTYFIFNTFMKLNNVAFFISEYANFYMIFIIMVYILTSYIIFVSYKKGYIK